MFASKLDIRGLLNVLPNCQSSQISELRGAIINIYNSANIANFLSSDKESLTKIKKGIEEVINKKLINDKIKLLQFEWFVNNINSIIKRLEE